MFDKRLFKLAPGIGRLVAGKVALMWIGLVANAAFVVALVGLIGSLLKAIDPHAQTAAFGTAWFGIFESLLGPATSDGPAAVTHSVDSASTTASASSVASMPLAGDLLLYLGVFVVIAIVRYLAVVGANRLGFEAAERVKISLRERLYRKMLALGPSYSSRVKTADVVQSAGEGIEQIQSFFEQFLPQLFYAILAPLTLFVILLPLNTPAAIVLLVCAPLIVIIVGMVAMSAARVFKKYWGKYTDLGAAFLDNLQGLGTLKIFDADERAARDMDVKAEEFRVMTMRVLQIQLRSLTAMDVVAYGGAAAGIGMAIWQYSAGSITLAGVLVIVLLSADFFIPLRQLGSFFHVAMNGMTSTKRIFALLDAPEPEHGDVELSASSQFVVAFERVGYAYHNADDKHTKNGTQSAPDNASSADIATRADIVANADNVGKTDSAALSDVSFMANPGQLTAIVGVSGSGKSTAAAIIAGTLLDYSGSAAVLDAHGKHELRTINANSLTRTVTLVSARSHLFSGTLRDNLLMACPDANDEQLWNALKVARIDDFVRSQAAGLDMPIEPDAANLSGGQRQRFAIARALLHDSAIYVFDEATSSVDVESEARILATIHELAAHKTVLMITHRMANAIDADMILVFSHGTVVESGKHAGLMAADGEYARLFRAQQSVERVGHASDRATIGNRVEGTTGVVPVSGENLGNEQSVSVDREASANRAANDNSVTSDNNAANNNNADHVDIDNAQAHSANANTSSDSSAVTASTTITPYQLIPRMLHIAAPLTRFMITACVCGTIGHIAATFLPVFGIIAAMSLAGHTVWGIGVAPAVTGMVICALIRGFMRYAEQFMNHNVAFRLLALFRSQAFAALRRLAPAKLDAKGKGDLIALITTDVEMLEIFFAHTISPVVIAATTTLVYAIVLCTLNPWMALLLIAAHLTVGVIIPALFARAVRDIGPKLRKDSAALDDRVLDGMRGIGEIIRFNQGEARVSDIVSRTQQLWAQRAILSRRNGRFAGLGVVIVLVFTVAAALLAFSGMNGRIAESVAAVVLVASSFGPTLALSALPASLTNTFAAARRLFALMDESPAIVERGTERPAYTGMAFDHVTFAYPAQNVQFGAQPDTQSVAQSGAQPAVPSAAQSGVQSAAPILRDYSLTIGRFGVIGVQGPSGRGKSTMLKLLMRYWDPQSGEVTFSECPLPSVDAHYLRRVQTMMSQETALFDGTIRDNLLIALQQNDDGTVLLNGADADTAQTDSVQANRGESVWVASNAEPVNTLLREACRKASVLELIDSLPDGFDTPVGELGDRLSEGERQRIGLARVFLRDADMVLFDEPTSRLDALNEAVILQSINTLASEREHAIVLVSHRESAMRIADRVITV